MDDAEQDVLAHMTFPKEHRTKLHSINPIERVNGEIKRRTEVVGIFPNDEAIVRLTSDQPYAARQPGWRRFIDNALHRGVWVLRRGADPRATLDALAPWLTLQEAVG